MHKLCPCLTSFHSNPDPDQEHERDYLLDQKLRYDEKIKRDTIKLLLLGKHIIIINSHF